MTRKISSGLLKGSQQIVSDRLSHKGYAPDSLKEPAQRVDLIAARGLQDFGQKDNLPESARQEK